MATVCCPGCGAVIPEDERDIPCEKCFYGHSAAIDADHEKRFPEWFRQARLIAQLHACIDAGDLTGAKAVALGLCAIPPPDEEC
jgi:hypothetical protein